jgi:hypothetical protein
MIAFNTPRSLLESDADGPASARYGYRQYPLPGHGGGVDFPKNSHSRACQAEDGMGGMRTGSARKVVTDERVGRRWPLHFGGTGRWSSHLHGTRKFDSGPAHGLTKGTRQLPWQPPQLPLLLTRPCNHRLRQARQHAHPRGRLATPRTSLRLYDRAEEVEQRVVYFEFADRNTALAKRAAARRRSLSARPLRGLRRRPCCRASVRARTERARHV